MKRALLACVLSLWVGVGAGTAQAGNRFDVTRIAFSPSSDRVMALVTGEWDGSGFGSADLQILGTARGNTVYRSSLTLDLPTAQVVAELLAAPATVQARQRQGLVPGITSVPRYLRPFARPYADWSDGIGAGQRQTTPASLWTAGVQAPVRLEVYPLPSSCQYREMLPEGSAPAGFRLWVRGQLVHQDMVLPPERHCAARYSLERVDVRGNRALFTLRAYGPGFEGPDADPVFVAATLR